MVAIKLLGIIFTFYIFFVLETFGQNFYPARYGKRDGNGYQDNKNLSENRRTGRSGVNEALSSRKMGFFISGGRFGKRGCPTENCFEGSKEIISSGYENRQDRSERIRIPTRKNQFMIGSRFGKRMDEENEIEDSGLLISEESLKCILAGINDLSKCLKGTKKMNEGDSTGTSSNVDFF